MNYQSKPVKQFVIPDDSLSQSLFDGTLAVKTGSAVERKVVVRRRGRIKLIDTARITNKASFDITLFEFDRAVFDAVISEVAAGNEYFTVAVIYRDLGGDPTHSTPKAMKDRIILSLVKLANLSITLDMKGSTKAGYDTSVVSNGSRALSLKLENIIFRSKAVNAYKFRKSLLYQVADMKNHIRRLDMEDMDISLKCTERAIAVKHYICRRVVEISGSHESATIGGKNCELESTVLFEEMYKRCGFINPSRWKKQDILAMSAVILNQLVENGVLESWVFKYSEDGDPDNRKIVGFDITPAPSCENSLQAD